MRQALWLLISLDKELWTIVGRSLLVSGLAVSAAGLIGIPLGAVAAVARQTKWLRSIMVAVNAFMGLPPVVVGLVVYLLLTRRGPLGEWQLLFTVPAMVLVQFILALPIVTGLSYSAVRSVDSGIRDAARTLGATPVQEVVAVLREAHSGILVAVAAGLGRVTAEVGAVMLVGGNIAERTRVMTTAIVLETRKGNFALALGLGVVLVLISLTLNIIISALGSRGGVHE